MSTPVSATVRMNIAGLDDKTLLELLAYFRASAECATNRETREEAVRYLLALTAEKANRDAAE